MDQSLTEVTSDLVERAGADAVIVTGARTSEPPKLSDVEQVMEVAGAIPVLVGSGITPDNVKNYSQLARNRDKNIGFIVGTYLKEDGRVKNPVDYERVQRLVEVLELK